ncbi:hypothetical protein MMC25_007760 [Agyrium rufum]|nr:hypothetical protein [Agyrium rufum]
MEKEDLERGKGGSAATRRSSLTTSENILISSSSRPLKEADLPPTALHTLRRASTSPIMTTTSPPTNLSPNPSRDASPIRPPQKPGTTPSSRISRSRKNSQDMSPHRALSTGGLNLPSVPSAAAIQRALSATGTTQLPSPTAPDFSTDPSKPQKPSRSTHPTGKIPSRLTSPPPAGSVRPPIHSPRKADHSTPLTPSIVVERPTPRALSTTDLKQEEEDASARPGLRTPLRGTSGGQTLETVQESSLPATPDLATWVAQSGRQAEAVRTSSTEEIPTDEAGKQKAMNKIIESESDSGGQQKLNQKTSDIKDSKKPTAANTTTAKAPQINTRKSFTSLNTARNRPANEGSVKNMTVETETVSSVPQVAVGGGTGERGLPNRGEGGGGLRLKPSSETIRPKKEKKKTTRKTPSIAAGTGGSSSRRFHHHHVYSRAPSPDHDLSTSSTSAHRSDSISGSPLPDNLHFAFSLRSGSIVQANARHRMGMDNDHLPVPSSYAPETLRSQTSASVLTSFRSRTASSKADIFERKVASAVDNADSSDSEETFVYESNPPESRSGRPSRYHSRTPSTTSMASQIDPYGSRQRSDGHPSIGGKKSMKFTNNSYHTNSHHETSETQFGPGGNNSARDTHHNHHIGRWGRGPAGHTSLFDNESPFPNATKSGRFSSHNSQRNSPQPNSPRNAHPGRLGFPGSKGSIYDLEAEAADDERTPLVSSMRSNRTRTSRRPGSRSTDLYEFDAHQPYSFWRRVVSCVVLVSLIALLVAAIVVALVLSSKKLEDVHVRDIQNVLTSEQEIMLDLEVHAINPNLVAIQVNELDVNIFAKSRYVGTGASWRKKLGYESALSDETGTAGQRRIENRIGDDNDDDDRDHHNGNVDEGTDPFPEDPAHDPQMMLLGRIRTFDSPLIFDPSPFKHKTMSSTGELRLFQPGNRSEVGSSERWEKVLKHSFDLTVRGVLKYTTPIGNKEQSVPIMGSVRVQPDTLSLLKEKKGI